MSSNLPPTGPPGGPPTPPPPAGPPSGGSPVGPPTGPPSAPPEVLEQGGGGPLPPGQRQQGSGGGRRKGLIIGGVVGALALGAAAFAAYSWYSSTGPQPAEALPADTIGYVSIDLDPSGSQKIAFYNMAKKFPAAKQWLDDEGIGSGDDVRKFIFEKIQEEEGVCEDVDFDDDVKPWMGNRFAAAAIDRGGETPDAVFVVQLDDADGAEERLERLIEECGGSTDDAGFAVTDDWLVVAETDEIAEEVVDGADEASLADDEDFQRWTDAAGDPGILTAYAAPEAGELIVEEFAGLGSLVASGDTDCATQFLDPADADGGYESYESCAPLDGAALDEEPVPDDVRQMFEDFEGMALTVRFDDGSLELETAGGPEFPGLSKLTGGDTAAEVIATLPEDTAAAYGLGLQPGWFDELVEYAGELSGSGAEVEEFLDQAEAEFDLSLPEDAETLLGESAAIAVSSEFDPEVIFGSMSGMAEVPVGIKVKGDTGEIEDVLDKIRATAPTPEDAEILSSKSEDGYVVVGPDPDYLSDLVGDGGLGDSEVFQDVVREDGASSVLFLNFDAVDGIVADLAAGEDDIVENFDPLEAFGITTWTDDDVQHMVWRVTTD